MRIKTATLRNYRIHRELTVQFDPARTLIAGPNEAGKSTLVEAIHRALFLKAKGNTSYHRAMQSTVHPGKPEVELVFEADGREYQLKKRFDGNGSVTLSSSHEAALSGQEAEEALSRLLSVEPGASGRAMQGQWAHLWVWQGSAGEDPTAHATEQRDALLQRLQETDETVALQSELDARVAGGFAEAAAAIYTQAGRPRAGSELDRAERAADEAEQELRRAKERFQQLQTAAADVESLRRQIPQVEETLRKLTGERATLETRERELTGLRQAETEQNFRVESARRRCKELDQAETSIAEKRQAVTQLEQELEPKQRRLAELEERRQSILAEAEQAERDCRAASDAVRMARLRCDLAAAWRRKFEAEETLASLTEKQNRVTEVREQLQSAQTELAELPKVDRNALEELRNLDAAANRARAALDAMAAGLEVVAADQPVRAGGQSLSKGDKQILTEDTELFIGDATRLRITPGGGTSLAEARQAEAEARDQLQRQLDSFGLRSLQEAAQVVERRNEMTARIEPLNARLDELKADTLDDDLSAARTEQSAAAAEVERLSGQVENPMAPEDRSQAESMERELRTALDASEGAEVQARARRDDAARRASEAAQQLEASRTEMEEERTRLNNLRAEIDVLIQTHGDDGARTEALSAARVEKEEAERVLNRTRDSIAALQPDLLASDKARIERSIEEQTRERAELREQLAATTAALRLDGTEDPKAALDCAAARARSAAEFRDSVRRKCQAIQLLNTLFEEEQRSLADQFTRPLVEKISGYLQCVFGPGAHAHVGLEENRFTGLRLSRPSDGGPTFTFDELSGGAREQMAAAVRLAMAEVLAADHGGCLPVVFDDAFAYSDPERVGQLQRMLDLAAARGLQIIVLTCNPADYAALGARIVRLRVERDQTRDLAATPADPIAGTASEDDRHRRFISALEAAGGSSGNIQLRQTLGWDDATYEEVKRELVAAGRIRMGRGRGGSVSLNQDSESATGEP